jgi:RNA polymerase sigma factor (sigma-70 family)
MRGKEGIIMSRSRQEEHALVERAQQGDREALAELMEAHRNAIRQLARRYRTPGLDEADLYQEGLIGFQHAVARFELARETRLWTFAQYWVQRYMVPLLRQQRGLSEEEYKQLSRVRAAMRQLSQTLQREPTMEEVVQASGLAHNMVQHLMQRVERPDVRIADGEGESPEDREGVVLPAAEVPPEARLLARERLRAKVQAWIQPLGPEQGSKWLVLYILHEAELFGYEWAEIADFLTDTSAEIAPLWAEVCEPFTGLIPQTWADVCKCFRTPAPLLNAGALRQWYGRLRRPLLDHVPGPARRL